MGIEKIKNDMNCYDLNLKKDGKTLQIFFGGNLDLYFSLSDGSNIPNDKDYTLCFDITKENYEIFTLFDSLYKDVISGNVFEKEFDFESNYSIDYTKRYEYSILVDNNLNITWVSDEDSIEAGDSFRISKVEDIYRLTFYRNDKPLNCGFKNPFAISVRLRNSGSRYDPFNCVFMRMFWNLQKLDPSYHQIHFEEVIYTKKLNRN